MTLTGTALGNMGAGSRGALRVLSEEVLGTDGLRLRGSGRAVTHLPGGSHHPGGIRGGETLVSPSDVTLPSF